MIRISAVDAVLDTVVDDESPAGALGPARRDDAIDACVYRFERRQQRARNDNARAR